MQEKLKKLDRAFWLDSKIVIAGGTGFLGKAFVSIFESLGCSNYRIISRNKKLKGSKYLYCDLTRKSEVEAIKKEIKSARFIFILASEFSPASTEDISFSAFQRNIVMVKNLVDVIPDDVSKVVLSSSTDVYGMPTGNFINEYHVVNPINYYALSKYIQERIVEYGLKDKAAKHLILRFTSIYGKSEPPIKFLSVLLDCIISSKTFTVYGDASEKRDFLNVEDAAIITLHLVQDAAAGGVFNISTGKGTAIKELLKIGEKVSGREISLEHKERVKPKVDLIYDNHKLLSFIKLFQFKPLYEGIKEQYEVLKERK